ncbi:hypothetical protein C0V97_00950 [Asaia sp. W19]|uniref:AAA family ATPase n=1 Tax=unclassified Asaia TaxID=2685023 RepID=UPI000F8F1783|nr:AAA family ATPase [Asaia sp. W19]RUT27367.1 hypothetical protein C0V97_00950 [Asaia sp. W19]
MNMAVIDKGNAEMAREELRARVRTEQARLGLSQKQIADQAGMSSGTFSTWLSNTYKGNYEAYDVLIVKWLESCSARSRIRAVRARAPEFVHTHTARKLMALMEAAQYGPELGVVAGAAGVGKTMAAKAYAGQNPNVWIITADESMKSAAATLIEIEDVLGCASERGSRRVRRVERFLEGRQGLIVIDEAQFLSTKAIEQLRSIFDKTQTGIVFMGNAPLNDRFGALGRLPDHAQLFSRIDEWEIIKGPVSQDVDAILDAWGELDSDVREACRAVAVQQGALRSMNKVLLKASTMARVRNAETISVDDVKAAWKKHMTGEMPAFRRIAA